MTPIRAIRVICGSNQERHMADVLKALGIAASILLGVVVFITIIVRLVVKRSEEAGGHH